MRAVSPPDRMSTASPCPTSHEATSHSPGRVAPPSTGATSADPTGTATSAASTQLAAARRSRRRRSPSVSQRASAVAAVRSSAPAASGNQGNRPPGRPAVPCATTAIHDAGSQATWRKAMPTDGSTGSTRQPSIPTMVPTGAAGAASRFAATPVDGDRRVEQHQHGLAGELGGERHAQRHRERQRHHPCQPRRQGGCEQEQPRRRAPQRARTRSLSRTTGRRPAAPSPRPRARPCPRPDGRRRSR